MRKLIMFSFLLALVGCGSSPEERKEAVIKLATLQTCAPIRARQYDYCQGDLFEGSSWYFQCTTPFEVEYGRCAHQINKQIEGWTENEVAQVYYEKELGP